MRRSAAWLLAFLAPLAACSLAVNLDDLSGGLGPDGSALANDASMPSQDGTTTMAPGQDATATATPDASDATAVGMDSDVVDGVVPPRDDGSTSDGPWCPANGTHTLCADFDERTLAFEYSDAGLQWTTYITTPGVLTLDSDASTSTPASLFSSVSSIDGAASAEEAALRLSLAGTTTSYHLELDFRPDYDAPIAFGTTNIVSFFEITTARVYYGMNFGVGSGGYYLATDALLAGDGGVSSSSHLLPALPVREWTHITIDEVRGTPGHVTVKYGSMTVLDAAPNTKTANNPELRFDLGFEVSHYSAGASAHIDNVVLDTRP